MIRNLIIYTYALVSNVVYLVDGLMPGLFSNIPLSLFLLVVKFIISSRPSITVVIWQINYNICLPSKQPIHWFLLMGSNIKSNHVAVKTVTYYGRTSGRTLTIKQQMQWFKNRTSWIYNRIMASLKTDEREDLLSRSLRPTLVWMRWIGIDLMFPKNRKPICIKFYAALCFVLHLIAQIVNLMLRFWLRPQVYLAGEKQYFHFESTASTFNYIVNFTSYTIYNLGSHMILLRIVRCRWNHLMTALRYCESFLHKTFYIRLYKVSICGVFYSFIQVYECAIVKSHRINFLK